MASHPPTFHASCIACSSAASGWFSMLSPSHHYSSPMHPSLIRRHFHHTCHSCHFCHHSPFLQPATWRETSVALAVAAAISAFHRLCLCHLRLAVSVCSPLPTSLFPSRLPLLPPLPLFAISAACHGCVPCLSRCRRRCVAIHPCCLRPRTQPQPCPAQPCAPQGNAPPSHRHMPAWYVLNSATDTARAAGAPYCGSVVEGLTYRVALCVSMSAIRTSPPLLCVLGHSFQGTCA